MLTRRRQVERCPHDHVTIYFENDGRCVWQITTCWGCGASWRDSIACLSPAP